METTRNAFLDGRLMIEQPKNGYRAGADPVFLAAATGARPGQSVLEVGCGVGTALLCLMARVPQIKAMGIEVQTELAELADRNFAGNGFDARIEVADIGDLPRDLRQMQFDHVITNPPFFDRLAGSRARNSGRELGRGGTVDLSVWIDICLGRLSAGGTFTMVNRMENLPDCLVSLVGRTGDITVLPLAARSGRAAKLFVLKGKKGAKGDFLLRAPLVLHKGETHLADGDSYTDAAQSILRRGAEISWND